MNLLPLILSSVMGITGDLVKEITLELGAIKTLSSPECTVISAYSSADSIVSIEVLGKVVKVRAEEFGSSTVTVFCESREVIYRVTVPTQTLRPRYIETGLDPFGSIGAIGLRLGFRSTRGLLDERISQDEFFHYAERHPDFFQSGALTTVDPVFHGDPKPFRIFDRINWQYRNRLGTRYLRVGDFDPLRKESNGVVRGIRIDQVWKGAAGSLFGGVARSGIGHPLTGLLASPVLGAGGGLNLEGSTRLLGYALGFEKNEGLDIPTGGMETGVRVITRLLPQADFELSLSADRNSRLAQEASLLLSPDPLSILASVTHTPDSFAVFTSPSRFAGKSDQFSLGAGLRLSEANTIHVGHARTLSFISKDGQDGRSELRDGSAEIRARIAEGLTFDLSSSVYQSKFEPYVAGGVQNEAGRRAQGQLYWEWLGNSSLTIRGATDLIEASLEGFAYDNQLLSIGWLQGFERTKINFIHFEIGGSRLEIPSNPGGSGGFLLSRVSGNWDAHFLKLNGRVQGESRFGGGLENTIRLQLGLTFTPTTEHEILLSISNNYEWLRTLYSNTRGLFFQYSLKFGTDVTPGEVPASWDRASVIGRVHIDEHPLENVLLELELEGETLTTLSDKDGLYRFHALPHGTGKLRIVTPQTSARLATASDRFIRLGAGSQIEEHFRFTNLAELRASVTSEGSPVSSGKVFIFENGSERSIPFENGAFQLFALPPGRYDFRLDPASLPTGYSPLNRVSINVGPAAIESISLMARVERVISGRLFFDQNGNRRWDAFEKGIESAKISFGKARGKTGRGGQFMFRNLAPFSGSVEYGACVSEPIQLGPDPITLHDVWVPCIPKSP